MRTCFLFLALFYCIAAAAQPLRPSEVNSSELILDLMKTNGKFSDRQIAVWYPSDFWQVIATQMKVQPEVVKMVSDEMSPYVMVAVVDYSGAPSQYVFRSEDALRPLIRLRDSSGKLIAPLEESAITPLAAQMLVNIRPTLAQAMGQFGEGMRIFLFPADALTGKPSMRMASSYRFSILWDKGALNWKLPLASALAPKFCPIDKEAMKGTWSFCPEHGVQLN